MKGFCQWTNTTIFNISKPLLVYTKSNYRTKKPFNLKNPQIKISKKTCQPSTYTHHITSHYVYHRINHDTFTSCVFARNHPKTTDKKINILSCTHPGFPRQHTRFYAIWHVIMIHELRGATHTTVIWNRMRNRCEKGR